MTPGDGWKAHDSSVVLNLSRYGWNTYNGWTSSMARKVWYFGFHGRKKGGNKQ